MDNHLSQYTVVSTTYSSSGAFNGFREQIERMMEMGWKPQGGVAVAAYNYPQLYQAMVKQDDDTED